MRLLILCAQMLQRNVSILLGGGKARVTQRLLDRTKVRCAFQQVSGERVPEGVGGQTASGRQAQPGFLDQALHIPRTQAPAADADEDRRLTVVFGLSEAQSVAFGEVSHQSSRRKFSE